MLIWSAMEKLAETVLHQCASPVSTRYCDDTTAEISLLIIKMVTRDMIPLIFVDGEGFYELMAFELKYKAVWSDFLNAGIINLPSVFLHSRKIYYWIIHISVDSMFGCMYKNLQIEIFSNKYSCLRYALLRNIVPANYFWPRLIFFWMLTQD